MKAIKGNKEYNVDENNKASYLAQGYTITDDDGTVIERPADASVSYEEYAKVKAELDAVKAKKKPPKEE